MNKLLKAVIIIFSSITLAFAQGFKVKATGEQTFNFEGKYGSQTSFSSSTPLEDFTGASKDVKGKVTFNVADIKTLKGSVSIPTSSLKTGIDLRDKDMRSDRWLDASSYPEISFVIKKVSDVKVIQDNRLKGNVAFSIQSHSSSPTIVSPGRIWVLRRRSTFRSSIKAGVSCTAA